MFSEKADFSKISDQPLYVTSAIQDAKIEVTEEGTEAAAATSVTIGKSNRGGGRHIRYNR